MPKINSHAIRTSAKVEARPTADNSGTYLVFESEKDWIKLRDDLMHREYYREYYRPEHRRRADGGMRTSHVAVETWDRRQ